MSSKRFRRSGIYFSVVLIKIVTLNEHDNSIWINHALKHQSLFDSVAHLDQ